MRSAVLDLQVRDMADAVIVPMTEEAMATWRRREGVAIRRHRGRYWQESSLPGFYTPIHLLARLRAEQATPPTPLCWGFRAALDEEDAAAANGSIPVHLLRDVEAFGPEDLPKERRAEVRKCQRQIRLVQLTAPAILEEQGYDIVISSLKRTRHRRPPTRAEYRAALRTLFDGSHWVVLGGLMGDRLGGYITGYAVDGVAYQVHGYYATEALPHHIVAGLILEFVQLCRRTEGIHEVVDGLHLREVPSLADAKRRWGFPVRHVPARTWMSPVVGSVIRWRRPHAYYRLTGRG